MSDDGQEAIPEGFLIDPAGRQEKDQGSRLRVLLVVCREQRSNIDASVAPLKVGYKS